MTRPSISRTWGWLALVLASVLYLHVFVLHKLTTADDPFFSAALDHQGLLEYLRFRYLHWTGRLPIEMALVLTINHMAVWKIVNASMVLWLCHSVGRIGFGNRLDLPARISCAFVLLLLISPRVLWEGAWWVTGSFNYLWPATLAAYGCLPFFDGDNPKPGAKLGHAIACGLAAYNEQVGLLLLGLLIPVLWVHRNELPRSGWKVALVVFVALNWLVTLTAPGVHHRFVLEHRWFANFDTLGFDEKFNIGLGLVKQGFLDPHNLLVALLVAIVIRPLLQSSVSVWAKVTVFCGLAYIGLMVCIAYLAPAFRLAQAFSVDAISGSNAAYPKAYLLMAISQFAIASLFTATALVFRESPKKALLVMWALLLGAASILALGWSPTAYASGSRIFFAASIVVLAIACSMLASIRDQYGTWTFRATMALCSVAAAFRYWQLITPAS